MSNFDLGDALSNIKAVRDAKIERDFNDQLTDIQEKYSGVIDTEQGIEKLGATTLGFVGTAKAVKDIYAKYKSKVKDLKDKLKSKDEQEDEDNLEGPGEEEGDDVANDLPEGFEGTQEEYDEITGDVEAPAEDAELPEGIGDINIPEDTFDIGPGDITQALKDTFSNTRDQVMQRVRQIRGEDEPQFSERGLDETEIDVPQSELGGGSITTTEPSGVGSGDVELTDVPGAEQQPSLETGDEGFTGTGDSASDAIADLSGDVEGISDAVGNSVNAVSNVASSATSALTEGGSALLEGGIEGGIEAAGAALDASVVGAPIGAILGIIGLIAGTATTVGSAVAEGVSSGKEQSETETAQDQEKQALANPPNYAGKFASQVRGSVAGFL